MMCLRKFRKITLLVCESSAVVMCTRVFWDVMNLSIRSMNLIIPIYCTGAVDSSLQEDPLSKLFSWKSNYFLISTYQYQCWLV